MRSNVVFFAWNRSIPGREHLTNEHFQEFSNYVQGLQKTGAIQSFDIVLLNPHGGDMNGFFLMRGEPTKLDSLLSSPEWESHQARAFLHLEGMGAVRGVTGDMVVERMGLWNKHIPA